jgi:branched-chain amino acid aminotransferase
MTTANTFTVHRTSSPVSAEDRAQLMTNPQFGRVFSDHMVSIRYSEADGWHDAKVEPRGPLLMDPSSAVFHYAQEIFEGMKAYKTASGGVTLFRPLENARRFQRSGKRMAMPPLPEETFLAAVTQLALIDRAWIPDGEGSLYLRPVMFASEVFLGVKSASDYIFLVLASSVGAYFKNGPKAVTVWVSETHTRAAFGGTGEAKCGGNYAASLVAQTEAAKQGCDQVVFLDAAERRWVEELGGMNIFFVFADGSLSTPPLGGTILAGITRDSLLQLARDRGLTAREEPYSFAQWREDAASGRLKEVFACGTAAVVTSIGQVRSSGGDFTVGDGAEGPVAASLREALVGIQRGLSNDPYGWVHQIA